MKVQSLQGNGQFLVSRNLHILKQTKQPNETNSAVCKSTLEGELRVVLAELSSGIERELALGTGEVAGTAPAFDDSGMGSSGESSQSRSKRGTRKVAKRKKSGTG